MGANLVRICAHPPSSEFRSASRRQSGRPNEATSVDHRLLATRVRLSSRARRWRPRRAPLTHSKNPHPRPATHLSAGGPRRARAPPPHPKLIIPHADSDNGWPNLAVLVSMSLLEFADVAPARAPIGPRGGAFPSSRRRAPGISPGPGMEGRPRMATVNHGSSRGAQAPAQTWRDDLRPEPLIDASSRTRRGVGMLGQCARRRVRGRPRRRNRLSSQARSAGEIAPQ